MSESLARAETALWQACQEAWSAASDWRQTVESHWHSPRPPRWMPPVWDGMITFAVGYGLLTIVVDDDDGLRIIADPLDRRKRGPYTREATRVVLRAARWYRWAAETTIAYSRSRAKARAAILEEVKAQAAELLLAGVTSQNGLAYIAHKWATRVFGDVRARLSPRPVVRPPEWVLPPQEEPQFGCTRPVYWWFERSSGSRWVFARVHGVHTPLTAAPDYLIADLLLLCRQAEEWLRRNP